MAGIILFCFSPHTHIFWYIHFSIKLYKKRKISVAGWHPSNTICTRLFVWPFFAWRRISMFKIFPLSFNLTYFSVTFRDDNGKSKAMVKNKTMAILLKCDLHVHCTAVHANCNERNLAWIVICPLNKSQFHIVHIDYTSCLITLSTSTITISATCWHSDAARDCNRSMCTMHTAIITVWTSNDMVANVWYENFTLIHLSGAINQHTHTNIDNGMLLLLLLLL